MCAMCLLSVVKLGRVEIDILLIATFLTLYLSETGLFVFRVICAKMIVLIMICMQIMPNAQNVHLQA